MAVHNETGKEGEELAALYLAKKEHEILYRNWRYSHYEIDIITLYAGILHFVEVKLRSSKAFGMPEEAVTPKKFRSLTKAADAFLYSHPQYRLIQFDILSINAVPGREPEYFMIEDVFL
jgi:putative endonuclease